MLCQCNHRVQFAGCLQIRFLMPSRGTAMSVCMSMCAPCINLSPTVLPCTWAVERGPRADPRRGARRRGQRANCGGLYREAVRCGPHS